jgi:hypothetical protein
VAEPRVESQCSESLAGPLGLAASTHLSQILVSVLTEAFSVSSTCGGLGDSSACFGKVNRAKYLRGVDVS